jgi:hypothetical protein
LLWQPPPLHPAHRHLMRAPDAVLPLMLCFTHEQVRSHCERHGRVEHRCYPGQAGWSDPGDSEKAFRHTSQMLFWPVLPLLACQTIPSSAIPLPPICRPRSGWCSSKTGVSAAHYATISCRQGGHSRLRSTDMPPCCAWGQCWLLRASSWMCLPEATLMLVAPLACCAVPTCHAVLSPALLRCFTSPC